MYYLKASSSVFWLSYFRVLGLILVLILKCFLPFCAFCCSELVFVCRCKKRALKIMGPIRRTPNHREKYYLRLRIYVYNWTDCTALVIYKCCVFTSQNWHSPYVCNWTDMHITCNLQVLCFYKSKLIHTALMFAIYVQV